MTANEYYSQCYTKIMVRLIRTLTGADLASVAMAGRIALDMAKGEAAGMQVESTFQNYMEEATDMSKESGNAGIFHMDLGTKQVTDATLILHFTGGLQESGVPKDSAEISGRVRALIQIHSDCKWMAENLGREYLRPTQRAADAFLN